MQQQLFAEEPALEAIADTNDKLYLAVRQVRESGYQHYPACMRAFGDMKRNSGAAPIDARIIQLKTVHRRYIEPLRELIDPNAEPVQKMALLRRRMADLGAIKALLGESVELDTRRTRLNVDIQYIDYTLIRHFETLIDTSRALLNSLMEEKSIKDALAGCLGNLEAVWQQMQENTVVAKGLLSNQAPSLDKLSIFFSDVVHRKFVPHPRPLHIRPPKEENADYLLLFEDVLLQCIEQHQHIDSWPGFVINEFATYSPDEQLKAIALPLVMSNPPFVIRMTGRPFAGDLKEFTVEMDDYNVTWNIANGR